MTRREIIGSAIVFSAVILSQIDFKKKDKSEEKSSDL